MKKLLLTLFVLSSLITFGQATFTNSGGNWTYTQDFNTLTTSTTAVAWADNSSVANVYGQRTGNGTTIIGNNGGGNGGTLYSYGTTAATERALGSIGSSNAAAGSFAYGIRIKNNTGSTIYSLQVGYVGEQWRNSAATAQTIAFSYITSSTAFASVNLSAGTTLPTGFVAVTGLDFTSPKTGGTAGSLDGNLAANRVSVSGNIIFDTPLPADGEVILRWNDPDHSGTDHGLSIDDVSLTAGLTPIPTLTVTPTSLNNINYLENNGPSGSSSFSVSGANLSPAADNLTITAPTNFEVSTNATTGFGATTTIPYTSGSLAVTSVYVRLASGLAAGIYGGATTYVVASGGTAPNMNVAVTGTVTTGNECGTAQTIASVRSTIPAQAAYTGTAGFIIDGTITGVFGANKFYVSDATGGIAVFTTGIVTNNSLKLGDRVKVTGSTARFNGESEILSVTCITRITAGTVPSPKVFDANTPPTGVSLNAFLAANEGDFVKIISANLNASGTFSTGQNYSVITCNEQGGTEIRVDAAATTLGGFAIPSVTQDIAGVLGHYITADGGTDKLQLYPRTPTDFSNSAVTCTLSSGGANGCGVATIVNDAPTLDVITWNVEWLGHPANGPSQSGAGDATQIANAKTVLNSIGADVFMLEEICSYNTANPYDNTTAFGKLLEGLNTTYGANAYSGECSPAVSGSVVDANPQRVCIIYKNSVVEKISGRVMFDGFTPDTYPTATPSQFWASGRKPYIFKAKVTLNSVVDTINFVGLHAKSGSDVTSYNRRKFDVRAMYDTLQAQYPNAKILIGGDINDDVDVSIYPNNISSYSPFLYTNPDETSITGARPNADFDPVTKALSDIRCSSTASYPDIIDHFILSNELKSGAAKFNYKTGSASNMHPYSLVSNYATTTSDHFPVLIRLRSQPCPTKPVITATSLNICGSGSVTLNVTGCNGTLNWTGGLTGSSITVSPTANKDYRVACTVVDCTSDSSDVASVIVKPIPAAPTLTATPTSVVLGQTSSLSATGCAGTVTWSLGSSTANPLVVTPNSTTTYTATCTVDGCVSPISTGVTVTVNSADPCQSQLTLASTADDYSSGVQLKQASSANGKITATNKITGTAISTYQAKVVELNTGFKADSGTVFKAEIGGCN